MGLGNPGKKYAGTRHNTGFFITEALIREYAAEPLSGDRFHCLLWRITLPQAGEWLLAEPQTFMNLSGDCVQPLAAWYRIPPHRILVIHDELDLPPGRMKCKCGGGNAGHNGLKSITQRLGTPDFFRLRIGIGKSPYPDDTINWVLGRPDADSIQKLKTMLPTIFQVIEFFAAGNAEKAVMEANGYK
ncbi:MAG: aminoacyl-tRNA hydrolase [Desulfovibrionaceae bacterium]|nr:aminoacyl-tRNA hydrolase [Desulfovibrionaceae bacterium]